MTNESDIYKVANRADYIARTKTINRLEEIGVDVDESDMYGYLA